MFLTRQVDDYVREMESAGRKNPALVSAEFAWARKIEARGETGCAEGCPISAHPAGPEDRLSRASPVSVMKAPDLRNRYDSTLLRLFKTRGDHGTNGDENRVHDGDDYYVLDMTNAPALREVLDDYLASNPPAATLVAVKKLARDEFMLEIEAIAVTAK